jgi:hypothetical protein
MPLSIKGLGNKISRNLELMDKLDQLIFLQAGKCFFCHQPINRDNANKEHLVAKSLGGTDCVDNLVACCKQTNEAFANLPVKEKLRLALEPRNGNFKCFTQLLRAPAPADANSVKCKSTKSPPVPAPVLALIGQSKSRPRTVKGLTNAIESRCRGKRVIVDPCLLPRKPGLFRFGIAAVISC